MIELHIVSYGLEGFCKNIFNRSASQIPPPPLETVSQSEDSSYWMPFATATEQTGRGESFRAEPLSN